MSIAYLGPEGSNSQVATLLIQQYLKLPGEAQAWQSFTELLQAVASGVCEWAVVPVENMLEGPVTEVLENLHRMAVRPVVEFHQPIQHALLVLPGTHSTDITQILSHPQALGQCRQTLHKQFPLAQLIPTASTAEAARQLAISEQRHHAALSPPLAAECYGLDMLHSDMSDCSDNITRFLLVGKASCQLPHSPRLAHCPLKTSLRVDIGDYPGSLVDVLLLFRRYQLNLTKIESRPAKRGLGRYQFYIDVAADITQAPFVQLLAQLQEETCEDLHVSGPYVCIGLKVLPPDNPVVPL